MSDQQKDSSQRTDENHTDPAQEQKAREDGYLPWALVLIFIAGTIAVYLKLEEAARFLEAPSW